MDYKLYLKKELEDTKDKIKYLKDEKKRYKTDIKEAERVLKKAKDETIIQTHQNEIDIATSAVKHIELEISQGQRKQALIERTMKLELMQLANGIVVDVSKLRLMHKKFKSHRLNFEYAQTAEGLIVSYSKNGVKGKMHLFAIYYKFPEQVTFPILEEGATIDA